MKVIAKTMEVRLNRVSFVVFLFYLRGRETYNKTHKNILLESKTNTRSIFRQTGASATEGIVF